MVGDAIPLVLTKDELAAGLGCSTRQVDRWRQRKNHPGVKELPGPGQPRFDGRVLSAWMNDGARKLFQKAG